MEKNRKASTGARDDDIELGELDVQDRRRNDSDNGGVSHGDEEGR